MNVHEINLDVSKEPAHEPALYIGQGDKNGTTLKVNMYDNGQALTLTGYTVTFSMRSPDAQDYYEVSGTVSNNTATFLIDETYAAGHPGVTDVAYINVINGNSSITSSSRLRVVVLPGAKDGVMPAPAYASEIEQFLDESQAAVDEIIDEAQEILDHGIPLMSSTTRGGAKLGTGLTVDNDEKLNVATATSSALGVVKPDGSTITIDNDGTLHGTGVYELPTMSASTKGGAKLGNGLDVTSDVLSVSPATTSEIGGVIPDGTTITVDNDGKIHGANTYTLPPATTSTLGGVIPDGSTISVDSDGTIHGTGLYTLPTMSASTKGGAKLGTGLGVDANDALNLAPATTSALGGVKPDGSTITVDNDGTIHGASTYSLPTMSASTKGGAKVGTGLAMTGEVLGLSGESYTTAEKTKLAGIEANANNYSLPAATTSTLGGVKPDGTTVTIDNDGTIHSAGSTIPTMSASTKGGAKLGEGLSVDSSDKLNLGPLTKHSTGVTDGSALYGVQADGWASQTTTTGKNLMPPKSSDEGSGITFTKNPDGSIKIYGTASGSITSYYTTITLASGTYTLSTGVTLPTGVSVGVGSGTVYAGDSSVTFTKSSSGSANCFIGISNGAQVDVTIYPQLEVGSSPTTYEPYTGGTASPNPSYPQEIKVARGRNLAKTPFSRFDYDSGRGVVFSQSNGIISAIGTVSQYFAYLTLCDNSHNVFNLVAGETYTISTTSKSGKVYPLTVDGDIASTVTYTFTLPSSGTWFVGVCVPSGVSINESFSVQLEQGSTPTPYVPYGNVGLEVTVPTSLYKSGYYLNDTGAEVSSGNFSIWSMVAASPQLTVRAVRDSGDSIRYHGYDVNGNWVKKLGEVNWSLGAGTFTSVLDIPSNVVTVRVSATNTTVFTATVTTPIPLPSKGFAGSIGTYTDKLTVDSAGGYEWTNKTNEVVFDGSSDESWGIGDSNGAKYPYTLSPNDSADMTADGIVALSSHYTRIVYDSFSRIAPENVGKFFFNASNFSSSNKRAVFIDNTNTASESAWRTWLTSNPVTILYPLATPTTEQSYIDLPSLPEGATVTIPELDNLGVDYWVSGIPEVTQYGLDMQARLQGEIDEAEQAIADNASNIATLQSAVSNISVLSKNTEVKTLAANDYTAIDCGFTVPSGQKIVGIIIIQPWSAAGLVLASFYMADSTTARAMYRNITGATISTEFTFKVLCMSA